MNSNISIHPIPAFKDNYIWAIIDKEKQKILIVDPGDERVVKKFLKEMALELSGILITHHHWDHTQGIEGLKNEFNVNIFGPKADSIANLTHPLQDNDHFQVEPFPFNLSVLAIPGHTKGHIAYLISDVLFCGDTLFAGGCGRIFEGTPSEMYASLQRIAALDEKTRLYCAHEYTLNNLLFAQEVEPDNPHILERIKRVQYLLNHKKASLPSVLKEEKETNPFLRCEVPTIIQSVSRYANKTLDEPVAVFTWLRKWKDHWR